MSTRYETPGTVLESHAIEHYHGDRVRELFIAGAALSFIAMPIWGDLLPYGTFAQVCAGLLLVLLAGLTNPHSRLVLWLDMIVAGVSVLLLETAAITFRTSESWALFTIREASALILLGAFYLSIKTVRAMSLGKLGQSARPDEFSA